MDQVGYGEVVESNTDEEPEETEEATVKIGKNTAIVKGIGETFEGYVIYNEEVDGKTVRTVRGTEGVEYTLNSVEFYDNFFDSGVELNTTITDMNGNITDITKNSIENNKFILVELTATYNAPAGGPDKVEVSVDPDLMPDYDENKMSDDWLDRYSEIRDKKNMVSLPHLAYFSDPPKGDTDLDINHDSYDFYLNDGESKTFKIGIMCWEEFIETENVYLCVNWFPPFYLKGYIHKYFALFPEE